MDELTEVREALRSGEVSQNALALRARRLGRRLSQRSLSNLMQEGWNPTVRVVRAAHGALKAIRAERTQAAKAGDLKSEAV